MFIFFKASCQHKYTCPIFSSKRMFKKQSSISLSRCLSFLLRISFYYTLINLVKLSTPFHRNLALLCYVIWNFKFAVSRLLRSPCLEISFKGSPVFGNILTLRKGNETILFIKETKHNIFCKSFKVRIFEVNCLGDEAYEFTIKFESNTNYSKVTHVYPVSYSKL